MKRKRTMCIISCLAIVAAIILSACAERPRLADFRYTIDTAITPAQPDLPGLDGGPPRAVGVVVGPDGRRDAFVVDEVILRPKSEDDLGNFLAQYGGKVLRDGTPLLLSDSEAPTEARTSSGWYLVRIDPQRSFLDDLPTNMTKGGSHDLHQFSSEGAAKLFALLARERVTKGLQIGPNIVVVPSATQEHPDGSGGFLDAETWWWMTDDDDQNTLGDQGLSIGVVRGWRYLGYKGVPPRNGIWTPPTIAIIDSGFDLDASGMPVSAAADIFPSRPRQIDLVDYEFPASGMNTLACGGLPCDWHGQQVLGIATAIHSNRFGGAGIAGGIAAPLLVRIDGSFYTMANGIRTAVLNGATVVNISAGGGCLVATWLCSLPPDDMYEMLRQAALFAASFNVIVV